MVLLRLALFVVGMALCIFGLAGWNAVWQGWGDDAVTTRDYKLYGSVALAAGVVFLVIASEI